MTNTEFKKHLWDVWAISVEENADISTARAMFFADVKCGEPVNTNMDPETIKELHEFWDGLTDEEKDEILDFYEFMSYAYYTKICELYAEEDKAGFSELVENPEPVRLATAKANLERKTTWAEACAAYGLDPEEAKPVPFKEL